MLAVGAIGLGAGACSGDDATFEDGSGASMATTGGGGAGAEGATGGGGGDGGSGAGPCVHEGPPIVDPASFPDCEPVCGGAHCVPAALVPDDQADLLAACNGGDGYCVPDKFIETNGQFLAKTCVSGAGAEGRCLSVCIPQVEEQAAALPVADCDAGEVCVPCFDPRTQEDTGACSLSCDQGPTEPPVELTCPWDGPAVIEPDTLPACDPACGGAHCLPESFVPPEQQALLATCPGGFCTPDAFIESGGETVPESCVSVAGAEGRCLSTCLQAVQDEPLLPQSTCADDERCAPCYNPTADDPNESTGACELACDAPVDPPVVLTCPWNGPPVLDPASLPECSPACGGAHCLDASQVPASQQALLATCPGGFCVPDPLIETGGNFVPQTCTAFPSTTVEGRCQSDCLPDVQAQIDSLQVDICAAGEHCVPCYDPFDGTATGACSASECDAPVDPPYTFPTCCPDSNGVDGATCVPSSLVPPDDAASLQQITCPTDFLCVPNEYLPDPPVSIDTCTTALGGAGACVSECVDIPFAFLFTQRDCPDNKLCVSCFLAPDTPGCP